MALESNALCTIDELKLYLDMGTDDEGDTDQDDDLLELIVNSLSKQIETYCRLSFAETTYTEYHDSNSNDTLFTNHYPITSVSGIFNDTGWSWAASTEVDSDTYRIADSNRIVLYNGTFGSANQNIKVVYNAGFTSTPYDVKLACIKEAGRLYRGRDAKGASFRREELPTGSSDSAYIVEEFLPETVAVLNRYRVKGAL